MNYEHRPSAFGDVPRWLTTHAGTTEMWPGLHSHRTVLFAAFSGSSELIGAPHGLPWQNNSMDFMTLPTWPKFWKSQMFPTKLMEIGLGMIWNTSFSHPEILVLDPTKNLTCRHQDVTLRIAREHAQQLPTCPNLSSSLRPRPFFWLLFSTRHHTPRFEARILGTPCPIISDSSTSLNTTGMRYLENKIDPQNHQKNAINRFISHSHWVFSFGFCRNYYVTVS